MNRRNEVCNFRSERLEVDPMDGDPMESRPANPAAQRTICASRPSTDAEKRVARIGTGFAASRPMKASEIRTKLLAQHAQLRVLVDKVRSASGLAKPQQSHDGQRAGEELQSALSMLVCALRDHNAEEEQLLRDVMVTVDAWGPARVEIMNEQHAREHRELYVRLSDAASPDASQMNICLDRLIEHMAIEEKAILSEDVLRDDVIAMDAFSG
jgi:hemerythrin